MIKTTKTLEIHIELAYKPTNYFYLTRLILPYCAYYLDENIQARWLATYQLKEYYKSAIVALGYKKCIK